MESWLPHPVFEFLPETLSGPTDLFFPIAANLFLMVLVSMVKVSLEILSCIFRKLSLLLNTDE
jgi:hypothetical protein